MKVTTIMFPIMDHIDGDNVTHPLLIFRVLSDPSGRPAGVLAEVGSGAVSGAVSGLREVLDDYPFLTLHLAMPVFFAGHPAAGSTTVAPLGQPDAVCRPQGRPALRMLQACEALEAGDFDALAGHLAAVCIDPAQFNAAMVDATTWMLSAVREG